VAAASPTFEEDPTVEDYRLLIDLHKGAQRQGPGGDAETEKALGLAGLDRSAPLEIADIGCGTGASTLVLARCSSGRITAVDLLQDFLDVLEERAQRLGLSHRVTPICRSMDALPFAPEALDVIWSEGAIYNLGFEKGVRDWARYLRPGGMLVVSEITWTTAARPAALERHWQAEYPEIATASTKMAVLEDSGYSPVGYFVLPERCWRENYYRSMQEGFQAFLERHGNSAEARAVVEAERREIALYEAYNAYFGYGVYIARRL
jgi:SAM-dependent methyltransferase